MNKISPWASAESAPLRLALGGKVFIRERGKAENELPMLHAIYAIYRMGQAEHEFDATDEQGNPVASLSRGRFSAEPEVLTALNAMKVLIAHERERILEEIRQQGTV